MVYRPLPTPAKSNKQIQEYVATARKGSRLVMPNGKGWRVISPDGRSTAKPAKREAVAAAEKDLAGSDSKVFVFNGKGELVDSYVPNN